MNPLRLSAAATALVAIFAAAAALGSCSTGPTITFSDCTTPAPGETAADGGPDPCHCTPPPSLNVTTCPCLSGTPQNAQQYEACMTVYREEEEASDGGADADGGPLPGCTGECWPPPPDYWGSPLLLWFGLENNAPPCPLEAPFVFYNGYATGNTFALACVGGVSGACPVPGEVCAPAYVDGFAQCVVDEGELDCPILGPYTEEHVFYEETDEQPARLSTFCCFPAPLSMP